MRLSLSNQRIESEVRKCVPASRKTLKRSSRQSSTIRHHPLLAVITLILFLGAQVSVAAANDDSQHSPKYTLGSGLLHVIAKAVDWVEERRNEYLIYREKEAQRPSPSGKFKSAFDERIAAEKKRAFEDCTNQPCDGCLDRDGCVWCDEGSAVDFSGAGSVGVCETGTECSNILVSPLTSKENCPLEERSTHNENTRDFLKNAQRYNIIQTMGSLEEINGGFCSPGTPVMGYFEDQPGLCKLSLGMKRSASDWWNGDLAVVVEDAKRDIEQDIGLDSVGLDDCNWCAYVEGVFIVPILAFVIACCAPCFCCCFFTWRLCGCCGSCKRSYGFFCRGKLRDPDKPEDAYSRKSVWVVRIAIFVLSGLVLIAMIIAAVGNSQLTEGLTQFISSFVNDIDAILTEVESIGDDADCLFEKMDEVGQIVDAKNDTWLKRDVPWLKRDVILPLSGLFAFRTLDFPELTVPPARLSKRDALSATDLEKSWAIIDSYEDNAKFFRDSVHSIALPSRSIAEAMLQTVARVVPGAGHLRDIANPRKRQTNPTSCQPSPLRGPLNTTREAVDGMIDEVFGVRDNIHKYNSMRESVMLGLLLPCFLITLCGVFGAILRLPKCSLFLACCGFCFFMIAWILFAIHWALVVLLGDFCIWFEGLIENADADNPALNFLADCNSLSPLDTLLDMIDDKIAEAYEKACSALDTACNVKGPGFNISDPLNTFDPSNPTAERPFVECPDVVCRNITDILLYLSMNITDFRLGCQDYAKLLIAVGAPPVPPNPGLLDPSINETLCPIQTNALDDLCLQSNGYIPGICDSREINLTACADECWNPYIRDAARSMGIVLEAVNDINALWNNKIKPLLNCERIVAIVNRIITFICTTTLNGLTAVAAGCAMMGILFIPVIVFAILGSKRFTNSFAKLKKKFEQEGIFAVINVFNEVDGDGTGQLTPADVHEVYSDAYPDRTEAERQAMVDKLFQMCDKDKKGFITSSDMEKAAKSDPEAADIILLLQKRLDATREARAEKKLASIAANGGAPPKDTDIEGATAPPLQSPRSRQRSMRSPRSPRSRKHSARSPSARSPRARSPRPLSPRAGGGGGDEDFLQVEVVQVEDLPPGPPTMAVTMEVPSAPPLPGTEAFEETPFGVPPPLPNEDYPQY